LTRAGAGKTFTAITAAYRLLKYGRMNRILFLVDTKSLGEEQAGHLRNDYKHRMSVNRTLCIGLLKSDLIYILLEKDPQKQDELFQKLYDEISENIVPVRPDRHYHRTKGQLAGNYSNTHKRSF
jgi:hypothetical protein